jgi:NAD(P)-dependent dehydrogenase (short-subunit alcohol dehydrogenase family)
MSPSWEEFLRLAPLACKTDKIDARVLATQSARDLVPEIWLPDPSIRRERELTRMGAPADIAAAAAFLASDDAAYTPGRRSSSTADYSSSSARRKPRRSQSRRSRR